jgi:hypothetical protein
MPPPATAAFAAIVELLTDNVRPLMMPPPRPRERLPEMVELVIVSVLLL